MRHGAGGSSTRVLVSGFEPFGGAAHNPSQDVARALDGTCLADGSVLHGVVLPVRFADASTALAAAIERTRPCLVLALGLATARSEVAIERVALNLCDAAIADNAGLQPRDMPVIEGGPAALFATLPVRAMLEALQAVGLPGTLSLSAGSYVCNEVFYRLLYAQGAEGIPAGFMHLPPIERMALNDQLRAVRMALDAALAEMSDDNNVTPGVLDIGRS
ncbi:MAG: pyroglutamyl-peptidase I [Methylibium sp.]|uniref:pyroglutamyl-peptidase I family protein n=1 Tax=Methylibium sp. TaxID=2067992 RepID=UPI0017966E6E|nr:pyroglutamyl-peptidase I [Methylibium sp.]MBA2721643.1 pyroglutamyl-peptidase I [Methylibium sp.]MBA3590049.1 pyroglutamyl-peptidase I [Methylibium sp.]